MFLLPVISLHFITSGGRSLEVHLLVPLRSHFSGFNLSFSNLSCSLLPKYNPVPAQLPTEWWPQTYHGVLYTPWLLFPSWHPVGSSAGRKMSPFLALLFVPNSQLLKTPYGAQKSEGSDTAEEGKINKRALLVSHHQGLTLEFCALQDRTLVWISITINDDIPPAQSSLLWRPHTLNHISLPLWCNCLQAFT